MSKDHIENIPFGKVRRQPLSFDICTIKELHDRFRDSIVNLYSPHRIEFHGLTVFTQGTGEHFVDFKKVTISPGTILPSLKGQVHAFEKKSQVKGYVISFDESYLSSGMSESNLFHFLQLYYTPHIHIGEENLASLQFYIKKLIRLQTSSNTNLRSELIQSLFIALLLEIKRNSIYQHRTFQSKRYKGFIAFQELIKVHYNQFHNVQDYAEKMSVSYKYLNDICKDLANVTAKTFLDKWLILEIKRKLTEKKNTFQEIAYEMGYEDVSNFIRFFKKHEGVTPSKFSAKV